MFLKNLFVVCFSSTFKRWSFNELRILTASLCLCQEFFESFLRLFSSPFCFLVCLALLPKKLASKYLRLYLFCLSFGTRLERVAYYRDLTLLRKSFLIFMTTFLQLFAILNLIQKLCTGLCTLNG